MDLYAIHPDPESAPGYAARHDTVPALVWERYHDRPEELKKREKALATDAMYAYDYALVVLRGPFPAGEAAIAKDADWAYDYARFVLNGPFPAGEAVIAEDAYYAYLYALHVLNGRFPAGEPAIATDPECTYGYAYYVLQLPEHEAKAFVGSLRSRHRWGRQ
jgi:hypothetical protein